jgi:AcrR family transcriptional regulator
MARPRSDDKRNAILDAAVRVIMKQGLSAPTAEIAREAGVASGTLFTYFDTKADLLNTLYLELKGEMATSALEGIPTKAKIRDQFLHMWTNWTRWAVHHPERRRALSQLGVSEEITPATRTASHQTMATIGALLQQAYSRGPLRDAPMGFVVAIMNSMAEATMDYMISDPSRADRHSKAGFEALWRVIG